MMEEDGWWAEAYTPDVGWALGDGHEHADIAAWDSMEAEQLYDILEQDVIPCFYRRDQFGMPRDWIARMRESMARLTTQFSSNRMLREYADAYYLPLADAYQRRAVDAAAELQHWYHQLVQHWNRIHFGNVRANRVEAGWQFEVQVYLDDVPAEAVSVQVYADAGNGAEPFCQNLARGAPLAGTNNAFNYQGAVPGDQAVAAYTPRIVPAHVDAMIPLEANFILWYR